ncbi:hypothetical protein D6764_02670 [Candidatus Woesearchaeota archaeon]|nr:MAG: hypothetical protein D6764_02670 [Candidatus Woesearchaeota archaeon]
MFLTRIGEFPPRYEMAPVLETRDKHLRAKMKILNSLSQHANVRAVFEKRYGRPDVDDESKAYVWRFIANRTIPFELRLNMMPSGSGGEELFLLTDANATFQEKDLLLTHFINILAEESKSVWQKAKEKRQISGSLKTSRFK